VASLDDLGVLSGPRPVLSRLSDVIPETVSWIWPGRIPARKLTVQEGDPGLGKTAIMLDIAARISAGLPMPDGRESDLEGPGGVVILTAEDGLGDTIRPRLEAAGADLHRIVALEAVLDERGERLPTVEDINALDVAIATVKARFVLIDPLVAYLDGETINANRDQDIRRALAPLAALAERTEAAIVAIRHLNKSAGGNPLYRGGASIGITAAARSVLLVAKDPADPNGPNRVLVSQKSNLAAPPVALTYYLEPLTNGSVRVVWVGPSEHTAASLLAIPTDEGERSQLEEAKDVLLQILEDGPVPAGDAKRRAKDAGVAEKTLERARMSLGIKPRKVGFGAPGHWVWDLPDTAKNAKNPEERQEIYRTPTGVLSEIAPNGSDWAGAPD
jgi:hypothetical protein